MGGVAELVGLSGPLPIWPLALLLLLGGGIAAAWPLLAGLGDRGDVKRRLRAGTVKELHAPKKDKVRGTRAVRARAAKSAHEFYAKADPENVARLRMRLIQAGYMDPGAVGIFFLIRFVALFGVGIVAFAVA